MRAAVVVIVILAARAAASPVADAHARRGVALYNLGKYEQAIEEFERAYTLVQTDALLFNLAQAHRQLDHCEQALQYYKRFMAGSPAPALAAQVETLLPKLEAACRTKLEQPMGATPAPPQPEVAAVPEPEEPAIEEAVVVEQPPRLRVDGALTAGTVISNKTAPTTGVAAGIAMPLPRWPSTEVGAVVGMARLWRAEDDRQATITDVGAIARFASQQSWARLSIGGALGATHISSLDTASGVVPGMRRAGLWIPSARAEAAVERDIADAFAVRVAFVVGASPRSGPMLEAMAQVGLHVGVRYVR